MKNDIHSRGKPELFRKNLVHLKMPASKDGVHDAYPICRNGAFHILWTADKKKVNCPDCLREIGK